MRKIKNREVSILRKKYILLKYLEIVKMNENYTYTIPLAEGFLNYKVDDVLYGKLLCAYSQYSLEEKSLYIPKEKVALARKGCGIQRDTFNRHFQKLIDVGVLENCRPISKVYKDSEMVEEYLVKTPNEEKLQYFILYKLTLEQLIAANTPNLIKIYSYLCFHYPVGSIYNFTIIELAQALGYSKNIDNQCYKMINDILDKLQKMNLITISDIIYTHKNGHIVSYHSLLGIGINEENRKRNKNMKKNKISSITNSLSSNYNFNF